MSKKGICHLCGKYSELTFEHIPPKAANNKDRARLLTGKEIFNTEKIKRGESLRYINQQQGAGYYTLCRNCNNNTGDWYAKEYIKFANCIGYVLTKKIDLSKAKGARLDFEKLYFQRIIKQILCMFLSTIQPYELDKLNDIRNYVLNSNNNDFNREKYRISMFLLKKYEIGHSGIIKALVKDNEGLSLKEFAIMNLYPVGFILEINPKGRNFEDTTDITSFTNLNYDDKINASITLSIIDKYSLNNFTKEFINKSKRED